MDLTESTIQANARFFDKPEDVPTQAYTMGIGTIMRAKRILLIASGKDKAALLGDAPVDATPLNGKQLNKTKAKMTAKNPFKPFAPDKKAKNRAKFNKNAKTFQMPAARRKSGKQMKKAA